MTGIKYTPICLQECFLDKKNTLVNSSTKGGTQQLHLGFANLKGQAKKIQPSSYPIIINT